MTAAFVVALVISVALRLWLSVRQVAHVRAHRAEVPDAFRERVGLDAHQKAADYTVTRTRFGRIGLVARALLLGAWTLGGGIEALAGLWGDGLLAGTALLLSAFAINEIVMLPLALYGTFVIEERFGFNRTTAKLFCLDLIKGLVLGAVIGGPIAAGALWLMGHGGALWWAWVWAAWFGVSLLFVWIYPAWIAPLFNRFEPLRDKDLDARIEALLDRTGFQSDGLFVMDGSRRSAHANAYFTGWGNRKRIVLFDTLCEMLTPSQVEAVLAHELGHYKRGHVWRRIASSAAFALAGLWVFSLVLGRPWFFEGLGVHAAAHATGLLLFLWVAPLFTFPLRPLLSAWSRKHEYEADAFAAEHADASALVQALVKLYERNAATLTPDPLHSAFHDSHPPAALRIARLETPGA